MPLCLMLVQHLVRLPKLVLFTRAEGELRRHFTPVVQSQGIQHQLNFILKPLQRALQRFLERLTMGSRIIAEFFDHHLCSRASPRIMTVNSPLKLWGQTLLPAHADTHSNANDHEESHPT